MRNLLFKTVLMGAAVLPSLAFAGTARTQSDVARAQIMRLHVQLTREAMAAPEIEDARKDAALAYATLYQVRENVLTVVRSSEQYGDLRLALWHQQQQLDGLHTEIPVKIMKIMDAAKDSMSVRAQISQLESAALDASDDYLAARDDTAQKLATYQRLLREAEEKVHSDPQLMGLSAQLRAMSTLHAGHGSLQTR